MVQVSIIVPVYNVEKYLDKCVSSILAQTYTDFELILVDDGSTDKCGIMCERLKDADSRIKVVHKKNGGVASARNVGLHIASGEFIMFCDSDDFVGEEWCSHFVDKVTPEKNNYIFGGIKRIYPNEMINDNESQIRSVSNLSEIDRVLELQFDNSVGYVWNTLFYKDVINKNNILFPEGVIVEDLPFVLEYLKHMQTITFTGYSDNYYRIDDRETLSRKYHKDGFLRWKEKYSATKKYIQSQFSVTEQKVWFAKLASYYLYPFLNSLNNTFDDRNTNTFISKLKYNNHVVNSEIFQECLRNAESAKENKRYIMLLKKRMYYIAYIYQTMAKFKNELRGE